MQRIALSCALFLCALLTTSLSSPIGAQGGTCEFQIVQSESNFTFGGTTSLGPIVGSPSTFALSGSLMVDLATEGNPISTGKLVSGDALVVGGLHAEVPNPLPFLPPLASIDITNLRLSPASPPFRGSVGSFMTDVVVTALSGSADVVPLIGDPSTVDMTGAVSSPAPSSATLLQNGNLIRIRVPVNLVIDISDPASGITGTVNLVGIMVADHDLSSGCNTSLFTANDPISLSLGGSAGLLLDSGVSNAGDFYWVFGSVTGTSPGIPLGPVILPLNFDPFFNLTLTKPGLGIFSNLFGFLDGAGQRLAGFSLPAGVDPTLAGVTLSFAYAAGPAPGVVDWASNPVSVLLGV